MVGRLSYNLLSAGAGSGPIVAVPANLEDSRKQTRGGRQSVGESRSLGREDRLNDSCCRLLKSCLPDADGVVLDHDVTFATAGRSPEADSGS
jgi:hypothetical protein